ncbi:axonemal dynein light chain domain-containing protein 1-like [Styela clava]
MVEQPDNQHVVPTESEALKIMKAPLSPNAAKEPLYSEMIPEDLLFALTEVNNLLETKKEGELAPVKTLKTPKEMRVALGKGIPDNVWHHKARRIQFRHLTDHPKSDGKTVGSKDISFLYDVSAMQKPPSEKPSRHDKSSSRSQASRELNATKSSSSNLAVPDSIIPDEYHLVKSKGVLGLEYMDEQMTTNLADKEKTLRVFPSLKPTKRFEVVQLMKTMDQMLAKAGVDDIENEAKGPTQIHNLLEIIKKEQQIYDVVFHEVIRQVSIECVERGQLISKLRQRYADLLNRIPRQIKSLHAEVMAQRSLDRRLTEELLRFKTSIGNLTNELIAVKEHDKKITQEAEIAQLDLSEALKESQKNANLVDEYHDLYELQRHRLETQVSILTEERDLWCNASYSLGLKIISENSLSTAKRLLVTEKAWHKLGCHFTVLISDCDTESLVQLHQHVEQWRDMIFHFHQVLDAADKTTANVLTLVKEGMEQWINTFEDTLMGYFEDTDIRTIKLPPSDLIESLQVDIAHWEEQLSENSERFGGDTLLSNQEQLIKMGKEVDSWTDVAITVYDRHRSDQGDRYPLHKVMTENNKTLQDLTKQLEIRISGENGVAKGMITMQNNLDTWNTRLINSMRGAEAISDTEWLRFFELMQDYVASLNDTIDCVGSQQKDEDRNNPDSSYDKIYVENSITKIQKWLKDTVNGIEGENGKMVAQVSSIHTRMIHWMVQMLLLLAPNKANKMPSESSLEASCSLEELTKKCQELSDHLSRITSYLCQCTHSIVQVSVQRKKDAGDDDADHEQRDFARVKSECKEWIRTCQLLLNTLLSEPILLLDETVIARLNQGKGGPKKSGSKDTQKEREIPQEKTTQEEEAVAEEAVAKESDVSVKTSEESVAKSETAKPAPTKSEEKVPERVSEENVKDEKPETQEQLPSKMTRSLEVIGADENVQTSSLDEIQTGKTPSQTNMSDGLTPPSSALTQTAYDAIAKMDEIQSQLLATEERAQEAEYKALEIEEDLNEAREKIRSLERQLAAAEKRSESETSSKPPTPVVEPPAVPSPEQAPTPTTDAMASKPGTADPGKRSSSRAGQEKKKSKSKKK